jgi:hypothetical protein
MDCSHSRMIPHFERIYLPPQPDPGHRAASTLPLLLKPIRITTVKGIGGTKPGVLLKNHTLMRTGF